MRSSSGTGRGSLATDDGGPTFYVRSPRAAAHVLRAPGQLGLGRAYVGGEIEVDDMDAVIELLDSWKPPPLEGADKRALLLGAVRAAGLTRPPKPPESELRPSGRRHSKERDARAVRHHYDVSNEFFALFLDDSMTYSCGIFSRGAQTLEEAQEEKLETVARKLALREGDRVLDVGCGWGSFPLWAATRHGASVVGITLSPPQAEKARQRAEAAGVADRVEIRVMDYRDLAGETFDAIASIGMVEHVGAVNIDTYARTLAGLLEPGGRLLNHGITRLRHTDAEAGAFSERYVFPDAAPLHLSRNLLALERAGFVDPPRRGLRLRLRRDPAPLGPAPGREPRRGGAPGRAGAGPGLAPLPARRPQRLRVRASPRSTRRAARSARSTAPARSGPSRRRPPPRTGSRTRPSPAPSRRRPRSSSATE